MEKNHVGDIIGETLSKLKDMVDSNVMIGQTIRTEDGVTLIPVSSVSIGFGGGGSDFQAKTGGQNLAFGGGAGGAVKVTPSAFIVVKDGNTRVINLAAQFNTVDKVIDAAPGIIDKAAAAFGKLGNKEAK